MVPRVETVAAEVNGQTLTFAVPDTATWQKATTVDIGTLKFAGPGVYHLDPVTWKGVSVFGVQLAPVP